MLLLFIFLEILPLVLVLLHLLKKKKKSFSLTEVLEGSLRFWGQYKSHLQWHRVLSFFCPSVIYSILFSNLLHSKVLKKQLFQFELCPFWHTPSYLGGKLKCAA